MTAAQPAGGQALGITEITESRFRSASVTAVALGALGLVLIAAWVLLTTLTRDVQLSRDGAAVAAGLACGLLGVLVARRQPGNPRAGSYSARRRASLPCWSAGCTRCSTIACITVGCRWARSR